MNQDKGWRFEGNERKYIDQVLKSGFAAVESGSMNERFEKSFAEIHDIKYAIAANSGTSTLHMGLYAIGIKPGDEVIIPSLSVAMCGFAVWQCDATTVFADSLADTFMMDPNDVESKITEKTRAIMPVHMFGNMCDMGRLLEISNKNNIPLIEDCAQCFLGKDDKGRKSGTIGDIGSWSFENSKHLSTGDGGIVCTNNEDYATKMRQFGGVGYRNINANSGKVRISRDKFQDPNWERFNIFAYNYRMPELCAAIGLAQCERIEKFVELRTKMGEEYTKALQDNELIIPQNIQTGYVNTYYTFAASFEGKKFNIEWQEFRKKYIEFGGDGIYASLQVIYNEPCFKNSKFLHKKTPVAEELQKKLMLFTTNQKNKEEREVQINALKQTLDFFSSKVK